MQTNYTAKALVVCLAFSALAAWGQETRGVIFGRVFDPQSAAVAGARVTVRNTDTNTRVLLKTNETGYYEAALLLPGNYVVEVEAEGFKRFVRSGISLPTGSRVEVGVRLEVGAVTESVSVTAEAPLLETDAVSAGRVMDNRTIMALPIMSNSSALLTQYTPGVSYAGTNAYHQVIAVVRASAYSTAGNVGGNEWSIDGAPNNGAKRRISMAPFTDTIREMKVETANFDASIGHTSGINISMMSRSGTNQYHGNLTWQHWQQRWQGSPFFVKQLYYRRIAEAEAAGDAALAQRLRSEDKQASGRSNMYAVTGGGPLTIPRLFQGRDRLFFFFSFTGFKDAKPPTPNSINHTIPTLANREGDFSQLLNVGAQYQLYDPLTVRPDPSRPTHFIRSPIPGNVLPKSRIVNPMYPHYVRFLPAPNNDPANPRQEPLNNFLATDMPYNWDYKSLNNRIDYHLSSSHRFFGRGSWGEFFCDELDWTHRTEKGLHLGCQARWSKSGTIDYTFVKSAATMVNVTIAANQYREGGVWTKPLQFPPSKVGLPAYLDEKAGKEALLPRVNVAGYQPISHPGFQNLERFTTLAAKTEISHIRGNHTLRWGLDTRRHQRTGGGGGNTSGRFAFDNYYTRRNDDTLTPAGSLGHSWAAFMMGIPTLMEISYEDSFVTQSPYYAGYVQDNWRLTRRLTVNLGMRLEYELGATERYNRAIGAFDETAKLPITDLARAAYARNPVAELAAAQFQVLGGSLYPGAGSVTRRLWRNEWMWLPRVAAAYQIAGKTVLRAGYGLFYDTLNVLNMGPSAASWLAAGSTYNFPEDRTGFARATTTVPSNDYGMTWLIGDPHRGIPPVSDPFPVRANGTRFNLPVRDQLGLMARAGQGWSFLNHEVRHARQQRWRLGVQRQLRASVLIDLAYAGSYSHRVPLSRTLSFLPEQFWADGLARNNAIATNLNANVPNPFFISNFQSLQSSHPLIYESMSGTPFFTSPTLRKHQLLRPYPHMNGLTRTFDSCGAVRTDALEVSITKRFTKGFNFHGAYTRLRNDAADFFYDEFDASPTWRESNEGRPHRLIATSVVELPFGPRRALLHRGWIGQIVGGFQVAVTYEWQPGPLLRFGNLFYYGDLSQINTGPRTLDRWFNTEGFETSSARAPASFHRRVFPTQISGLRADMTNQWNANIQREFRLAERIALQLRLDAINLQNRSQFAAPTLTPTSTNFGRVTSQANSVNRFLQAQARFVF